MLYMLSLIKHIQQSYPNPAETPCRLGNNVVFLFSALLIVSGSVSVLPLVGICVHECEGQGGAGWVAVRD